MTRIDTKGVEIVFIWGSTHTKIQVVAEYQDAVIIRDGNPYTRIQQSETMIERTSNLDLPEGGILIMLPSVGFKLVHGSLYLQAYGKGHELSNVEDFKIGIEAMKRLEKLMQSGIDVNLPRYNLLADS